MRPHHRHKAIGRNKLGAQIGRGKAESGEVVIAPKRLNLCADNCSNGLVVQRHWLMAVLQ